MLRPLRGTPSGVFLAPLLMTLLVSCAHHGAPGGGGGEAAHNALPPEPVEVVLTVINHHFLDVTVFVEHDGQRTRIGTVTAVSTHQFLFPFPVLCVSH